jgi:hypothetical protein
MTNSTTDRKIKVRDVPVQMSIDLVYEVWGNVLLKLVVPITAKPRAAIATTSRAVADLTGWRKYDSHDIIMSIDNGIYT